MARHQKTLARFPYRERAAAVETARLEIHSSLSRVRHRNDTSDPATRNWLDAIAAFRAALREALPTHFYQALDEVRVGHADGVATLIDYLVADPYCFGSGYLKADVLKVIRRLPHDEKQAERLRGVVLRVLDAGDRREFRHYCRLARSVRTPALEHEISLRLESADKATRRRAGWMLVALRQEP